MEAEVLGSAMSVDALAGKLVSVVDVANFVVEKASDIEVVGHYSKVKDWKGNEISVLVDMDDDSKFLIVSGLQDYYLGQVVAVKGILKFELFEAGIYPKVVASDVRVVEEMNREPEEEIFDDFDEELEELKKNRKDRSLSLEVKRILQNPDNNYRLKLYVIHDKDSKSMEDLFKATESRFKGYSHFLEVKDREVSFQDDNELASVVEEADGDIIFILGSCENEGRVSVDGGLKSAVALVEKDKPFYVVSGCKNNKVLRVLEELCDEKYNTPADLGIALGDALKEFEKKEKEKIVKELHLVVASLYDIKDELENMRDELKEAVKKKRLASRSTKQETADDITKDMTDLNENGESYSEELDEAEDGVIDKHIFSNIKDMLKDEAESSQNKGEHLKRIKELIPELNKVQSNLKDAVKEFKHQEAVIGLMQSLMSELDKLQTNLQNVKSKLKNEYKTTSITQDLDQHIEELNCNTK